MSYEEQRNSCSSDSSDDSFLKLEDDYKVDPAGRKSRGRSFSQSPACRILLVGSFLALITISLVACLLLSLIMFGKLCVIHNDQGGARWPSSLEPCSNAPDTNKQPASLHYINLVIDLAGLDNCTASYSSLPCKKIREYITGSADDSKAHKNFGYPVGPLKCFDDAFEERGGRNNCLGNEFRLTSNKLGVVIPENGVYRVHSTTSFVDTVDYYISTTIRIDPADCAHGGVECPATDQTGRTGGAHTWLTCANHHRGNPGNKFSSCVIDGVRRFQKGDIVSFSVPQAFRSINPYYKTTQFFVYKL